MTLVKEKLMYSNYIIYKNKQSKIDPTHWWNEEIGMKCPRCKKDLPPARRGLRTLYCLGYGQKQVCPCGLKMELFGNALYCELEMEE